MPLPWIAKPDRGGDHQLRIVQDPTQPIDLKNTFYQRWHPAQTVKKVYSIGQRHETVELTYRSASDITKPKREHVGLASGDLSEAAGSIASATGLEVFNTDFIDHQGKPLAIDVNPFPSLESVPNSHQHLWQLIENG